MPRNSETSAKAERDQLRDRMRGMGAPVPQIAADMGRRFRLRPRVAWRHALGWPQWKLAQRYNTLHPGAKLNESRISEYESWPHGGNPPSLRYLARLAATFGHGCTPAQLVDADDLEHFNPADRTLLTAAPPPNTAEGTAPPPSRRRSKVPGEPALPPDLAEWTAALRLPKPDDLAVLLMTCLGSSGLLDGDALGMPSDQDRAYHQLVQFLTGWAHTMKRRAMLRTLGWAATAASVGCSFDPDEVARVGSVLTSTARLDARTIGHLDTVLWHCKRQDDALGPQGALDTVLAQRELARSLLPQCPATLRPQLLSMLGNASRMAGWFSFNLDDVTNAVHYHNDARNQAHEAGNIELGALVLAEMSGVATSARRPGIGVDHAVAACEWANRTGDRRLRALCADGAARAYAADGQRNACFRALDTAQTELALVDDQEPGYTRRYGSEVHLSKRGKCHLDLGEAERAAECAQQSLADTDPAYTRRVALTTIALGRARTQSKEIDEAARLFGDAGEIVAHNSSIRLIQILRQGRAELRHWQHTPAVRALDDRLTALGLASA